MTPKSQALMDELISAAASFGGGATPARLKRLGEARLGLRTYVEGLEEELRWIPVSERLPEIEDGDSKDYDVVLTYPFRRYVIVATWSYDALDKTHRRRWFDCSSDEWGSDDITEYVTHWRERPTPPEVQE